MKTEYDVIEDNERRLEAYHDNALEALYDKVDRNALKRADAFNAIQDGKPETLTMVVKAFGNPPGQKAIIVGNRRTNVLRIEDDSQTSQELGEGTQLTLAEKRATVAV